jgi:hypothetical protein
MYALEGIVPLGRSCSVCLRSVGVQQNHEIRSINESMRCRNPNGQSSNLLTDVRRIQSAKSRKWGLSSEYYAFFVVCSSISRPHNEYTGAYLDSACVQRLLQPAQFTYFPMFTETKPTLYFLEYEHQRCPHEWDFSQLKELFAAAIMHCKMVEDSAGLRWTVV